MPAEDDANLYEDVHASNDPIESSPRGIKRERNSHSQTRDDEEAERKKVKNSDVTSVQNERTAFDCYDFSNLIRTNQTRMKEESRANSAAVSQSEVKKERDVAASPEIISDERDDEDGETPPDTSKNLKIVYDVEYRTPE